MDTNSTAPADLLEYSIGGSMKHNLETFAVTLLSAKQQLDLVIFFKVTVSECHFETEGKDK